MTITSSLALMYFSAKGFRNLRERILSDVGDAVFYQTVIIVKTHAGEDIIDDIQIFRQYPLTLRPKTDRITIIPKNLDIKFKLSNNHLI